jgi:hypothetical protein
VGGGGGVIVLCVVQIISEQINVPLG